MAQTKRLIFSVTGLEKSFGSNNVLTVKKLEIHPGTIYGVIGTVGSGKSTLLNILSGVDQQSSGIVLYDDQPYERNWLGRIVAHEEVFIHDIQKFMVLVKLFLPTYQENLGRKKM